MIVEHTDTAAPACPSLRQHGPPRNRPRANALQRRIQTRQVVRQLRAAHGRDPLPDRRAKFAALDQGLKPLPRKRPKRFQQPDLKPANENRAANARAGDQADQDAYAAPPESDAGRRLETPQGGRTARPMERLPHRAAGDPRPAQFQLDQIYKHKRNRNALPLSIQGFRDWKETREWTETDGRGSRPKGAGSNTARRTLFGFLGNAIALSARHAAHRQGPFSDAV